MTEVKKCAHCGFIQTLLDDDAVYTLWFIGRSEKKEIYYFCGDKCVAKFEAMHHMNLQYDHINKIQKTYPKIGFFNVTNKDTNKTELYEIYVCLKKKKYMILTAETNEKIKKNVVDYFMSVLPSIV